jgi:transposase
MSLHQAAPDPGYRTVGRYCDRSLDRQRSGFHKGREFAAWMGLVPKQHSTGGKAKLYGISKRGNCYLRKILVHGARAVVLRSKGDRIAMGAWLTALEMRAPRKTS